MRTLYFGFILLLTLMFLPTAVFALVEKIETISIPSGNKTVKYVSFHPTEDYALKPVLAGSKVGLTAELAAMANEHQAVAAINGTFFNSYDAKDLQPMGALMINREAVHIRGGAVSMGISGDGRELSFAVEDSVKIYGGINGSRVWPNKWYAWFMNHLPSSDQEIVVFTPEFRSKEVNIVNFDFVVVNQGKIEAIKREHAVIPDNGFLIAIGSAVQNKKQLELFKVGDTAEYWVEYPKALTNALHMISVGPKLVTNGLVDVDFVRDNMTDPKLTKDAAQRSFIGHKKDGTIVMGTVGGSNILELAAVLVRLGLFEAMNLDGGASSGLYSNGKYITQPGRKLSNSLVLVKQKKSPKVILNETEVFFKDAIPFIDNGTTMVPVRGVFEELGAVLEWNGVTQTVTAKRFDSQIELTVGKMEAIVNGQVNPLLKAPVKINGRVYIPLRFVSEALGAEVGWNQAEYRVSIESKILTARYHFETANQLLTSDKAKSLEQYELAVLLDPTLEDAWKHLALIYMSDKNYDKAVSAYQQVKDIRISNSLGWAAYSNQDFILAEESFTKGIGVEGLTVGAHYGLGVTYMHTAVNRRTDAVIHFNKVIELDPNGLDAQKAEGFLEILTE